MRTVFMAEAFYDFHSLTFVGFFEGGSDGCLVGA